MIQIACLLYLPDVFDLIYSLLCIAGHAYTLRDNDGLLSMASLALKGSWSKPDYKVVNVVKVVEITNITLQRR